MRTEFLLTIQKKSEAITGLVLRTGKWMALAVPRRLLGLHGRNNRVPQERKSELVWHKVTGGPLQGHYMLLNLSSPAFWHREMKEGSYDSFIYNTLCQIAPIQGANVWDIGAHVGYHSLAFAALVGPSGSVVAFEPNPHNVERFRQHIERNVELKKRITLMTIALGNVDGEQDFVFSPEIDNGRSSGSHLNRAFAPEDSQVYESFIHAKIPVLTADTLLRDNRIAAPSVIKIDVEGAESLVLEGAQNVLNDIKPILLIEVHHILAMHDTLGILLGSGYRTGIVAEAPNTSSRCFIVAQPTDVRPLKS